MNEVNKPAGEYPPLLKPGPLGLIQYTAGDMLNYAEATCAMRAAQHAVAAEKSLRKILNAVQRYMPPDGPSAYDTMTEIIAVVDPWPLTKPATEAPKQEQTDDTALTNAYAEGRKDEREEAVRVVLQMVEALQGCTKYEESDYDALSAGLQYIKERST